MVSSGVLQQTLHVQSAMQSGPDARGIAGLYTIIPAYRHAQRSRYGDQATGRTTGAWSIGRGEGLRAEVSGQRSTYDIVTVLEGTTP